MICAILGLAISLTPAAIAQTQVSDLNPGSEVRADFNAAKNDVRVVILLSPS